MIFERFTHNLLQSSTVPQEQREMIEEYGSSFFDGVDHLVGRLKYEDEPYQDSQQRLKWYKLGGSVIDKLVRDDLVKSDGDYRFDDTPQQRQPIIKAAESFAKEITKTITGEKQHDLVSDPSEELALGLIGVHYAIWSPYYAVKAPAKNYLSTARRNLMQQLIKPAGGAFARQQEYHANRWK